MELIAEGAEAKIYLIENKLRKIRIEKNYRIKEIDEKLRKKRNKREFKVYSKLYENGVNVPKPIELNEREFYFDFEYIKGSILKNTINETKIENAFKQIIKIHNLDIIHGDLTTLNMIDSDSKIYIIDFGLSEFTYKVEDKAVDLNLFFNCIKNEHPNLYKAKSKLEELYLNKANNSKNVIDRLNQIEKRGRNKN